MRRVASILAAILGVERDPRTAGADSTASTCARRASSAIGAQGMIVNHSVYLPGLARVRVGARGPMNDLRTSSTARDREEPE